MNEWIMMDQKGRLVKMGRVEPFDGMVSVLTREHDLGGYASINGLLLTCEYYYMRTVGAMVCSSSCTSLEHEAL